MEGSTATRRITATTMAEAFRDTVERVPDRVAVRTRDDSVSLTWKELAQRVDALAGGLAKLGVKRGDTVALMFGNRPEFHLADLAVMTLGATPFSIYQTYTAGQIQYIVSDAGAKVAIIEEQFREVFLEARKDLPELESVIVVDGDGSGDTLTLEEVEASNPDFDAEAAWRAVRARRHPHPDLHLGDDRAAQGRRAHPPQPAVGRRDRRGDHRLP